MVFKRRTPRSWARAFLEFFYPRGGWRRAAYYVAHRLRRLPDPAHRISRGIAAGVFVSFTPFFGFHFILAGAIAWLMRGNILASLLATFFGNPLTFPIIATVSVETGSWLLGKPPIPLPRVVGAFSYASLELWSNFKAIFTSDVTEWARLSDFFLNVFLPYFVGGLIPGVFTALVCYYVSNPVIASYQRGRIRRMKDRFERRQALKAAARAKAEAEAAAKKADAAQEAD